MAKTPKASSRNNPAALKQHSSTPVSNGDVYVNVSCTKDTRDAAIRWAEDNGLKNPQDTFRVAVTRFLKNAGYINK